MGKLVILHRHRFELWNAPRWVGQRLAREFPQFRIVHLDSYDELPAEIADTEIFIGWSLRPEQFAEARRLRWIHSPAAAVHQLMIPEICASDVVITNASTVHGPVVAEHVIALLFALAKRLPSAVRYQQQHRWAQDQMWQERPCPRELAGSTLLLIGYGSIGREVGSRARALGMRIIVVREHPQAEAQVETHPAAELDALLPAADYVVLAVPVTPATTSLINRARLARMKPDASLINVGRGALIDEGALADALRSHAIGSAALDVFVTEPLPSDSPLWDLENLLITPHTAALTERLWERHYALIAENLRRYLAGRPLLNAVDKSKGY